MHSVSVPEITHLTFVASLHIAWIWWKSLGFLESDGPGSYFQTILLVDQGQGDFHIHVHRRAQHTAGALRRRSIALILIVSLRPL